MQKTKLLIGIILGLTIAFIGFRVFKQDTIADFIRPIIVPLVTVLYCTRTNRRRGHFFYFLFLFSLGELLGVLYYYLPYYNIMDDVMYYGCNTLYIAAYVSLILYILKLFDFNRVFKQFSAHIVILLALDIYAVVLVADIAFKSVNLNSIYDYAMELAYNTAIMLLLTVAVINYLNKDSRKAMHLLIGSICIVFSEVIQVAYYYVSEIYILKVAYCLLLVVAFFLFYIQNWLYHNVPKVYSVDKPEVIKKAEAS